MAQKKENEKGFLVLETSAAETAEWDGLPICDDCGANAPKGYLIAVLNHWYCQECYDRWYEEAIHYEGDKTFEKRTYNNYAKLLKIEPIPHKKREKSNTVLDTTPDEILGLYVLENKVPRLAKTFKEWMISMEQSGRIVEQTKIGIVNISTVFLGADASLSKNPSLFETMIFGGVHDRYRAKYKTWDEAVAGHQKAIELVQNNN